MKLSPGLAYTVRRLALFLATLVFAAAVLRGVPFIIVVGVSAVVSGILSYFLLAGPREHLARNVGGRLGRIGARIDASAAAEDAAVDAADAASRSPESTGRRAGDERPEQ